MKKTHLRLVALILCIATLLSLCSCQKESGKEPADTEQKAETFTLNESYNIVRGQFYEKSEEIIASIQMLRDASLAVYGKTPYLCSDIRRAGDTSVNEFEILVGDTNRDQSKELIKTLGVNDFTYYVESKNVIVICGGSPEATLEGVKQFCLDVLGYDSETKKASTQNVSITVGEKFSYTYDYKYENAVINGVDVNDFVIAVKNDKNIINGYKAAKLFSSLTGVSIPVVKYSDLDGTEKAVICVGANDRKGNKASSLAVGYLVTNTTENGLLTIGVSVTQDKFYTQAFKKLADNMTIVGEAENATVSLPAAQIYGTGYEDITPVWTLRTQRNETLTDGVVYSERLYIDEDNLPYRVYMLTVDTTKVNFYTGSSADAYKCALAESERENVMEHMKAAVANGIDVVAGINANHFAINGDYSPSGLAVKEGTLIQNGVATRPYFAVTKDGKLVMGENGTEVDPSTLHTAVSGSYYIVHNSLPKNIDMENEFGYTNHPRTLIGLKSDGTFVMAVIDGRQEKHSNGASLGKCAEFMIDEGCVQAINLDGGGSSTFIIRNGNSYATKNSPSDGKLRDLPISLLIVKKK